MTAMKLARLPEMKWTLPMFALLLSVPAAAAPPGLFERYGDAGRHFDELEIGDMRVYFHQRTIGEATVEKEYIVYQLDKDTGELLARKSQWRDNLPVDMPQARLSQAQAEALVAGEILFSRLYIISPESDVFPLDPAPRNPCWVVRSLDEHGEYVVTIIDAVTEAILGNGVPPPYTAFSMTGPQYDYPCAGAWTSWSNSAEWWFNTMGYSTEKVEWPTEAKVQSHVQSDDTAMFYELAHGGSASFANGCLGGTSYEIVTATEIETWMADYEKMPFAFIGSCDGMCSTGNHTFASEFRRGSSENTTVVGYCGMSEAQCGVCWTYSLPWQEALFNYMNQGYTVKEAFDQANADYTTCSGANNCMRFVGDEDFAVVPSVHRWRDCNGNDVPDTQDLTAGTSLDCNSDGVPDECQLSGNDCNSNSNPDDCDVADLEAGVTPPSEQLTCPGGEAIFTIAAPGASDFQWYKDGHLLEDEGGHISGALTDTLTVSNVNALQDEGSYACQAVEDGCIVALSDPATLDVSVLAAIVIQPDPQTLFCLDTVATITVTAEGTDVEYEWRKNDIPLSDGGSISGADTNTLQIADADETDEGAYTCRVWDVACGGQDESDPSVLQIANAEFTLQPLDACTTVGGTAQFIAQATAVPELSYRWFKDDQMIFDGGGYSGTGTDTLSISDVTGAQHAGLYKVAAYGDDPYCPEYSDEVELLVAGYPECTKGDIDEDCDFDLADLQRFTFCFGADVTIRPECDCANVDAADNVVDIADWTALEPLITGPLTGS